MSIFVIGITCLVVFTTASFSNDETFTSWINITSSILNILYFLCSQCLVICYLFFFGCCVSVCKIKMKKASDSVPDFKDHYDCLEVFRIQLENYSKFKDSVSFGLFLIFTLETVQVIFFVFVTIQMMGMVSWLTSVCYVIWCTFLLLIIVYLGLAAEDTDQMRHMLIDNMW